MSTPIRHLAGTNSSSEELRDPTESLDSNVVIILAALLCALISVLGIIAVARCAWIRQSSGNTARTGFSLPQISASKGLKKKDLQSLPKFTFSGSGDGKDAECTICLMEFVNGEEIRVLPPCGHGFHVGCIDMWLKSHSSCPSCRQILVGERCQKCGGIPTNSSCVNDIEMGLKAREDDDNRFLP